MLDLFHIAKPQGCDIQVFYGQGTGASVSSFSWIKPRGVSNIYTLLIGGGGNGDGTTGGGSGAVTVWYGSAQNFPDRLEVHPSTGNAVATTIRYYGTNGTNTLLNAVAGNTSIAGNAMTANQFAASGFFQSIAGQAGTTGNPATPTTTFLQAGGGAASGAIGNYGYVSSSDGFFQMQPIICTVGASNGANPATAGIGGGGTRSTSSKGGPGMVLIASW